MNEAFIMIKSDWLRLDLIILVIAIGLFITLILLFYAFFKQKLQKNQTLKQDQKFEFSLNELQKNQHEMNSRLQAVGEIFSSQYADMMKIMDQRLVNISGNIGQSIIENTKVTSENLMKLQERLAVIDRAQNNVTTLTEQVLELQKILGNKQTRGAFAEAQMQLIIQDGLPKGAYQFQQKLSNNKIPDCLIKMPNNAAPLVIDAKFPLESWNAIRSSKTPDAQKRAKQSFRRDVEEHIKAISEKYLIADETHDQAFMFVPSESVFSEIHENYESLLQKAYRARVVIVSPSLLMLSIRVIQSILKDAKMRQQAHLIKREVYSLLEDINRLDTRVNKFSEHFNKIQIDMEMIVTSVGKISNRGRRIANSDLAENQ